MKEGEKSQQEFRTECSAFFENVGLSSRILGFFAEVGSDIGHSLEISENPLNSVEFSSNFAIISFKDQGSRINTRVVKFDALSELTKKNRKRSEKTQILELHRKSWRASKIMNKPSGKFTCKIGFHLAESEPQKEMSKPN